MPAQAIWSYPSNGHIVTTPEPWLKITFSAWRATPGGMTVRDLLTELQHLPRDLELLTFEAG
jgi:hypothetical protein